MEKQQEIKMVLLPQSVWDDVIGKLKSIEAKVISIENKVDGFRTSSGMNKWVESEDARKQFGVSSRTWQAMRDNRQIPFTQFGRKIYVKQADIETFMMSHYVEAKNKSKGIWNAIKEDK